MFNRQEKIVLGLLAAINFTHIIDFMIMMPLGPQLMRLFAIDPHQFGLLVSSYTFLAGISGFLATFFIDRFDRKHALLVLYLGFSLGTLLCGFASSYQILLILRGVTGFFGGILSSVVLSIVSDTISVERRGTAMGVIMGAFSLASVGGVPFSLYLASHWSWHMPFFVLGCLAMGIGFLTAWYLPSMAAHLKGPHLHDQDPFFAIKHIAKNSNQLNALLFMFTLVFCQFSIIPFISAAFVSNGGLSEGQLPLIYLFGGIISFFASPGAGRLSDRYGRKILFYISASATFVPLFLITNVSPNPVWVLLFFSSSFFLVMSGRMVPAMALVSSAAVPRYRASFMSTVSCVQQLSSAAASYISGLIVVRSASGQLLNYNKVGWISMAFNLFSIFLISRVKQEEK